MEFTMTTHPSFTDRTARPHAANQRRVSSDPSSDAGSDVAPIDLETLLPAFGRLVAETVAQVEACPPKPDTTFDGYEALLAAIRSATTLEGMVLEKGIALVAAINPDLVLVPLERPLPVHETAKAVFRRNDWSKASSLRLDSEVATREFYKPDLLIVDAALRLALVIDVKRSVASYKPRALSELRSRMMASALVVRDVLERDHDAPPVASADIAIIDGAGDCRDEAKGIFALADLDWMLRIDGAAAAITRLRGLYGARVRAVLDHRCAAIVAPRLQRHSVKGGEGAAAEDEWPDGATYEAADAVTDEAAINAPGATADEDSDDLAHPDVDEDGHGALSPDAHRTAPSLTRNVRPRVAVGIASRRAH
jgi:hypothetical protein